MMWLVRLGKLEFYDKIYILDFETTFIDFYFLLCSPDLTVYHFGP